MGWWLMTHESASMAFIGVLACGVFAADLSYLASRWQGFRTEFDRGFLLGFGAPLIAVVGAKLLGLNRAIGPDRVEAARRIGLGNSFAVAILALSLGLAYDLEGHFPLGFLLGCLAALAALFTVLSLWWRARGVPSRSRSA
jgi:hypothetical protein